MDIELNCLFVVMVLDYLNYRTIVKLTQNYELIY